MLIIWGSASGKTNVLLNLIKEKKNSNHLINKIYFYAKDLNKPKNQFLIKNHESAEIKHLNNQKAFKEYSVYMDEVYNNINDYNSKLNCVLRHDCWYYDYD